MLALTLSAAPSLAQGPMAEGQGTADLSLTQAPITAAQAPVGLSVDGEFGSGPVPGTLDMGLPDLGSDDLASLTQAQGSAPPPSQDQGSDAGQNAPARRRLAVNPITGLVPATEASYTALTGEERWRLYWKMNYFSIGAYFGPVFSALALDQATGSPAQWGGGFQGYGRRVASRTANAILQGTFQAPAAYLLHEDVRYIVSKRTGFKHRALHAIAYSFLTYNNSGHPTFNFANLTAYYGSTAVSTAWLPGHYKVLDYTLSNSTEQIGLTVPVNLLQEFWPEIVRVLHHPR
jgi:hypothetical protein